MSSRLPLGLLAAALLLAAPGLASATPGADRVPAARSAPSLATPFTSQLTLDLGGASPAVALGYENVVARVRGRHRVLARAGLGTLPATVDGRLTAGHLVVPLGIRYLLGFGAHHLELGVALPLRLGLGKARGPGEPLASVAFVPSLGWRYEDFYGGPVFVGAAYSPRITRGMLGLTFGHWVRVSVGLRL